MEWVVGIGIALFVLFFVIGAFAQKKDGNDMTTGGTAYIRFAAAVLLCTLLERMQRQELGASENAGRIDPERLLPTAMAAGQKVFGDGMTSELMTEELRKVAAYGANYLIDVKAHELYGPAKKRCTIERKDDIILAAMTALQLNFQEPAMEFAALRLFAGGFYDNPLDCDRRMLGVESPVNLLERSIELANEIVRTLNALAAARSATTGEAG